MKKNIYFLSDFHLGIPTAAESKEREKKIVSFLRAIAPCCERLYLLGDLFDFWYEYQYVVPKGFTRFLGTLSDLTDRGIPVYCFTGNHDLWMYGYLSEECGVQIIRQPQYLRIGDKQWLIAHGDGLGPGQKSYKIMKKIFQNPCLQWLFSHLLHPDTALRLGLYWSKKSQQQQKKNKAHAQFLGIEKEFLTQYCLEILKTRHIDYFVFGHRHIPTLLPLKKDSWYCNTGDWLTHYSYLVYDGVQMRLAHY